MAYKKISEYTAESTTLDAIGDGKVHSLTGVDFETVPPRGRYDDVANAIRFRLDGKIYVGIEDPSDGYRSCLADIQVVSGPPIKNRFPAVKVRAEYRSRNEYTSCDILSLVDVENNEVVLEVGTDNNDDYYPSFVHWFSPEKLSVNQRVGFA